MNIKKYLTLTRLLVLSSALATAIRAQSSAPSDNSSASNPSNDVVKLQAFDVTADAAHGYVASETSTGTRIASKIVETPFAVNVITADFIEDFAAFDLNSQLSFVSGFSPSEVFGQYQLRGFAASTSLVDGFRRVGLIDTVDIQRIEIIKGSAASIYGAITPGGVVNYITNQPTSKPTQKFEIDGGGNAFYRGAYSSSGPIGQSKHFFYRVDIADQSRHYAEQFASRHQAYISGKLQYKSSEKTSITLDIEHSELYEHPFTQALTVTEKQIMPWAGNSITQSQYYGMTTSPELGLLNYNYAGPESYNHNRLTSATLTLQHRINNFWSLKFGANAFTNPYNDQIVGSGAYYPYGTGTVTSTNGIINNPFTPVVKDQPAANWKPQRGGGLQLDNLFQFNTGPIAHKLLVTADYYENAQRTVSLVPTVGGSQATDYYALYSPYNPSGASYYTMQSTWSPALGYGWNTTLYGQNPALYNGVTADQWLASADKGLFVSDRATLFNDRLILMVGGRYDTVANQVKNYNIPASGLNGVLTSEPTAYQNFDYNTSATTYQLGASFKIKEGIYAYANKSTAFNPQPQINSFTGVALPNNTSNGYEFGFKTSVLQNHLNITLDHFVISEANLLQNQTDPISGLKDTILLPEVKAKGYEFDVSYQATDNLLLFGGWGYTQTSNTDSGQLTFLQALPARRVPRNNVGYGARYQFSRGSLKGLFFVADVKYTSKSLVNLGSGKSLIPGPAGTSIGTTGNMYYVAATNTTYATGTDPKIAGEQKITTTPVINVPFPGNGNLPYPAIAGGATINYPVSPTGTPLPLVNASTPGVYSGTPGGVFVDDGREYNFNAPYAVFDAGVGYSWKTMKKTNDTIRLEVKNLLNRKYTYGSGTPGSPFQLMITFNVKL
jgi:outer membrane receptor protein involved in Fe transport